MGSVDKVVREFGLASVYVGHSSFSELVSVNVRTRLFWALGVFKLTPVFTICTCNLGAPLSFRREHRDRFFVHFTPVSVDRW
jgi:hypothetical protein